MSVRTYRLVLVGCVLAWFLLGLHVPALAGIGHDGHRVPSLVIAFSSAFAVAGAAGLSILLRVRAPTGRD